MRRPTPWGPVVARTIALVGLTLFPGPEIACAAEPTCSVSVTNHLGLPRMGEMVELDWQQLKDRLPGTQSDAVVVLAEGTVLPSQLLGDRGDGSCDRLVFQADFAPQQTRRFTVTVGPPKGELLKARTHAIFVEHPNLDFLAWENDRIAFRLYGPLCEKSLVSSGVDVWAKRVARPILDTMSQRNYHADNGEGVDCYKVGTGRGCGGLGIWKDDRLYVSRNLKTWKILADGPLRVVVELSYEPWEAGGVTVGEVKRISLDAGSQLNRIESTLHLTGADSVVAAVGLGVPKSATATLRPQQGWGAVWQGTDGQDNGMLGLGMVTPRPNQIELKQTPDHLLMLTSVNSDQPLVCYAGAGWTKYGFADAAAWNTYLEEFAQRLVSPLEVTW